MESTPTCPRIDKALEKISQNAGILYNPNKGFKFE